MKDARISGLALSCAIVGGFLLGLGIRDLHEISKPPVHEDRIRTKFVWGQKVKITGGFFAGQTGTVDRLVSKSDDYKPYGSWFFVDIDDDYRCVMVHQDDLAPCLQ